MSIHIEVQGHFSLMEAGETSGFMVNMNENGRKEYVQPKMQVIEIETTDIIATSTETGGTISGGGGSTDE